MDWNSKADRLIRKYDKHKTGVGCGQPAPSGRRESQRGEGGQAHSIETPSFAHGSQFMMFKKKSKSVERVGGGVMQTTLGMAKMQRMRPIKKRRLGEGMR